MKIPKQFKVAGLTVDVHLDEELFMETGAIGRLFYSDQTIEIDPSVAKQETTEQAYWHEVTHYILKVQGREDLCNDEVFVEGFSHLLYQVLSTSRVLYR